MDPIDDQLAEMDRLVQAGERSMRELGAAMRELRGLSGTGASRSGAVAARVDADCRLADLTINPRAMRLGSDALGREVVEAVNAALLDHERQARELISVVPDGELLLESFQRDLAEIQDSYAEETGRRLDGLRRRRD
ncbi:MAG: YbaB/EbfC family nucleoid-associated protein [Nonomuraea sp.]|nr:YbaB/EbfC family nucleoid-associated protein [Nonomuraea sp.]